MKRVAILGSTGSIGRSALAVADAHPSRVSVVALAAGENAALLAEQIRRHRPSVVAVATEGARDELLRRLSSSDDPGPKGPGLHVQGPGPKGPGLHGQGAGRHWPGQILVGAEGRLAIATHADADIVLCASAGTTGLEAAMAALTAGKTLALANKEVLVMAGALMVDAAARHGVAILPVDSEHNAIHQCLHGRARSEVRRLILTASGGPFRQLSADAMSRVTPDDALRHPTWQMGKKITIDSATLMNKGLEVIEARWLFAMPPSQIDVVIHPQSVVHSMTELRDGSIIAQLGVTDMRLPIQYAFSYPDRWDGALPSLDVARLGTLEFSAPDVDRFPCLRLAYDALTHGGAWPAVLNAANEVAVEAFLAGRAGFTAIPSTIARTLDAADAHVSAPASLEDVRAIDAWARDFAARTLQP